MLDKNEQKLQKAIAENFDEEDDVILPDTHFGEIVYIYYILKDIIINKTDRKKKFQNLIRQIRIYKRWVQVKNI